MVCRFLHVQALGRHTGNGDQIAKIAQRLVKMALNSGIELCREIRDRIRHATSAFLSKVG
jgi:hypothetical protein